MKALRVTRIAFACIITISLALGLYLWFSEAAVQNSAENEIIKFVDEQRDFIDEVMEYLRCDRKDIYIERLNESKTGIQKLNSFESALSYIEDSFNSFVFKISEDGIDYDKSESYEKNEQYKEKILELRSSFNTMRDNFHKEFMGTDE